MAPTIKIHADPCTINCHKVLAGLQIMNVPYDLVHVDYFKAEQKSEANMKLNPCATLPFAVIDGGANGGQTVITESNAILQYAADLQGDESFYPKDLLDRARVNRWLLWESSQWFPSCYVYVVEHVVKPLLGSQADPAVIEAEAPRMNKLCKILDDQLSKTKYLCGDKMTIADISVASPMHLYTDSELPLDKYPNLLRWQQERIEVCKPWMETQKAVMILVPNSKSKQNTKQTNGGQVNEQSGDSVVTDFNYTKDDAEKPPTLYFYDDPKAAEIREPGDDCRKQTVYNGWSRASSFSVDREGFALQELKTDFEDWEEETRVQQEFYPEVVEFLKKTLGAKRVLVFDHTIRAARNQAKKLTQETNTSQRAPVQLVHCDYTAESGPIRVQQLMKEEAGDLMKRRLAFINVWKPIRRVVEERPLAMCDVTTSPPEDFMKLYLHYRDRIGENYVMRYSDKQKWYYFPKMTPDQVILLKTYESATDGRARFVGHTAFIDPNSPPDAPMRESIEIRTIAFF